MTSVTRVSLLTFLGTQTDGRTRALQEVEICCFIAGRKRVWARRVVKSGFNRIRIFRSVQFKNCPRICSAVHSAVGNSISPPTPNHHTPFLYPPLSLSLSASLPRLLNDKTLRRQRLIIRDGSSKSRCATGRRGAIFRILGGPVSRRPEEAVWFDEKVV